MGWVFSSLVEVILSAISGIINFFLSVYGDFGFDIGYNQSTEFGALVKPDYYKNAEGLLDQIFPAAGNYLPLFMYLGLGLVFAILIFKVMQAIFDSEGKTDHPLSTAGRSIIAALGVVYSYSIFVCVEKIAQQFYTPFQELFQSIESLGLPSIADYIASPDTLFKSSVANRIGGLALSIIALILFIALLIQFVRLLLEAFERYVMLGVMFYTCPLAFATLSSNSTKKIFYSWLQMLISQFLLMALNLFFLGMFYVGYITIFAPADPSISGALQTLLGVALNINVKTTYMFEDGADFVCKMFILLGWLTAGQKVDQHLRSLGLSVSQTGAGLGAAVLGGIKGAKDIISGTSRAVSKTKSIHDTVAEGRKTAKINDSTLGENTYAKGVTPQQVINNLERDKQTGNLTEAGVAGAMTMRKTYDEKDITLGGEDAMVAADTIQSKMGEGTAISLKNSDGVFESAAPMASASISDGKLTTMDSDGNEILQFGDADKWHAEDSFGNEAAAFVGNVDSVDIVQPCTQGNIDHGVSVLGERLENSSYISDENLRNRLIGGSWIEDKATGSHIALDSAGREVLRWTPNTETDSVGNTRFTGGYTATTGSIDKATGTYAVDRNIAQAGLDQVVRYNRQLGSMKNSADESIMSQTGFTYSVQDLNTKGYNYQGVAGFTEVKPAATTLVNNSKETKEVIYASKSEKNMSEYVNRNYSRENEKVATKVGRGVNKAEAVVKETKSNTSNAVESLINMLKK